MERNESNDDHIDKFISEFKCSPELRKESTSEDAQQITQEDYSSMLLDKSVQDPEFAQMLLSARQHIEYLRKNPDKRFEREVELARNIINGTAKLEPIEDILKEMEEEDE